MSETKYTTVREIAGGNFRASLSKSERGALFFSIARSFFFNGKMITQEIKGLAQQLEELEYMTGQLRAERDKLSGNGHKEGA
jgi:hypothetical protein